MKIKLPVIFMLTVFLIGCKYKQNSKKKESEFSSNSLLDSSDLNKLAAEYEHGKISFGKYCNACHSSPQKKITEQFFFDNLFQRLPSPPEEYFIRFIQDSKELKSSGDKYSLEMSKVWESDYEHYFKDSLAEQDINDLIIYIKVAAKQKNK